MQEVTELEPFAVALFLSGIVQQIVERVRSSYEAFGGNRIVIVAWGLGVAAAYGVDLNLVMDTIGGDVQDWFDKVLTGIAIGSGSGLLASFKTRSA